MSEGVRGPRWIPIAASVVAIAGLSVAVFFLVVAGLGHLPTDADWELVMAAGAAAMLVGLLAPAVDRRVRAGVGKLGRRSHRVTPDDAVKRFGQGLSRSVPLEELGLQAAGSLRGALGLRSVEIRTLVGDRLRGWVSDPEREVSPISLDGVDPRNVTHAGVSGHGWLQVWMPAVLEARANAQVRFAPISYSGQLLGAIIAEAAPSPGFTPEGERVLTEFSRQLGVLFHNAKLDSALQASLDEVQRQAAELQASRGRIVAAADAARRKIERDLHDGAQQRLVALKVKVSLASRVVEKDVDRAGAILGELGGDLDEAIQELRDLAHGIYPPLLADSGLGAALTSAGGKAAQAVTVQVAHDVGRASPEVEATAYFCCLEAIQNAGKYAGADARVTVEVRRGPGGLVFTVQDDGAGFDVRESVRGAGFENMQDRLGAIGGTLRVESTPGRGTRVTGVIPLDDRAPDDRSGSMGITESSPG